MIFSTVRFWLTAGLLLSVMGTLQVLSALRENQTWDEAFELGAGYNYWKTGVYRFNLEQPPVGKLISAFPLLLLNPSIPVDHPSYTKPDDVEFGHEFLYRNRLPADRILFVGRLGTIALTLLFGLTLALWSRKKFGEPSALLGLTLFAFDPNLIAHGRYATTDLAAAAFIFFACIAWIAFLEEPGKRRLARAGVMLGLALATKHSGLLLIPVWMCLHGIARWRHPALFRLGAMLTTWTALALLVYATVVITYAPEANLFVPAATKLGLTHPALPLVQEFVNRSSNYGELLFQISRWLSLAPNSYIVGLSDFFNHNAVGHPSYLLGAFATKGWWYYFPIVFLVKTPSAVLLTLTLLPLLAVRYRVRPSFRTLPLEWLGVLLPAAVLFGASLSSHIDLGVRHLLPIYPFLYVAIGAGLFRLIPAISRPGAVVMISCLLILESCLTFPNYLSFFNILCGGVNSGPKYLLESNIDWGQDLKKLRVFLTPYGNVPVCLAYFGNADLDYYGFASVGVIPWTTDAGGRERVNCMAAISVNLLYGLYTDAGAYSWLRAQKPLARVGGSIYVYDLRNEPRRVP
jgi:hypothetical protein